MNNLGIICGSGRFPFMVADGARRAGFRVIGIGLAGHADPALAQHVDHLHWAGVLRLGRCIRLLRRERCQNVIMAGGVRKADMYNAGGVRRWLQTWPDWTTLKLWYFNLPDKQPATVLRGVVATFARRGITVEDSTRFTLDSLAAPGYLTARRPRASELRDIAFGWNIAKELSRIDIGQSIAVKEQEVIAVEAIEGTDDMIARTGGLCRSGGWCMIKVSRPDQDMRYDVPTVGPRTIERMHEHGGKVLCIEAGRTVIVQVDDVIRLADRYGISIIVQQARQRVLLTD